MPKDFALSDEALRALGRMAWAAINLEDWTNGVCEEVLSEWDSRTPIGEHIKQATTEAEGWPPTDTTLRAISWLRASGALMTRRNQILHGVPIRLAGTGSDAVVYIEKVQKATGLRPPSTQTVLSTDVLNGVADEIEQQLDGYVDAHLAFDGAKRARAELAEFNDSGSA